MGTGKSEWRFFIADAISTWQEIGCRDAAAHILEESYLNKHRKNNPSLSKMAAPSVIVTSNGGNSPLLKRQRPLTAVIKLGFELKYQVEKVTY